MRKMEDLVALLGVVLVLAVSTCISQTAPTGNNTTTTSGSTSSPPVTPTRKYNAQCPSTTNLHHGRHFSRCHNDWQPANLEWKSNDMAYQGLIVVDLIRPIGCRAKVKQWRMQLTQPCLLKMIILTEDSPEGGRGTMPTSLRHFTEKASVSAFMQPDSLGHATVDFDQLEETLEVEKGNIVALVQLNTTSSASCLCFGRSKRGGKLWSALHHGHIESGPVASPPIVTEPSVAFSEQYPANGPDATQAADTADSYDPLRSQRRRRQTVQEAGGDVFLLQARLGRVSWNLVLDTTDGAGDLESRHINFFGDDGDMAETDAAVPTGAQSSPEQNSVARQPTTAPVAPAAVATPAATPNPALSDSIVITNFVSERVFGLTGTMQLIFDMTSLDQPTLGNDVITPASQTPLVTDAITPRVLPSSPDRFDAVTRADTDTPLVNGNETVGGTSSEGFSRKSIFPIILAVGILLTLAALIVIIITCVRAHRRRSVQRKVYSKHIVNSTVASMERERRRQRNNNGRLNRFSRQNRRRNESAGGLDCLRPQPVPTFGSGGAGSNAFREAHEALTARHTIQYDTREAEEGPQSGELNQTDGGIQAGIAEPAAVVFTTDPVESVANNRRHVPYNVTSFTDPNASGSGARVQRRSTFERPAGRNFPDPPPPSFPASRVSIRVHVGKGVDDDMGEIESQHTLARPQLSDIPERISHGLSDGSSRKSALLLSQKPSLMYSSSVSSFSSQKEGTCTDSGSEYDDTVDLNRHVASRVSSLVTDGYRTSSIERAMLEAASHDQEHYYSNGNAAHSSAPTSRERLDDMAERHIDSYSDDNVFEAMATNPATVWPHFTTAKPASALPKLKTGRVGSVHYDETCVAMKSYLEKHGAMPASGRSESLPTGSQCPDFEEPVHLYTLPLRRHSTKTGAPPKPKRRSSSVRYPPSRLALRKQCEKQRRKSNGATLDQDDDTTDVTVQTESQPATSETHDSSTTSTLTDDKLVVQFRNEVGEVRMHQYALMEDSS